MRGVREECIVIGRFGFIMSDIGVTKRRPVRFKIFRRSSKRIRTRASDGLPGRLGATRGDSPSPDFIRESPGD